MNERMKSKTDLLWTTKTPILVSGMAAASSGESSAVSLVMSLRSSVTAYDSVFRLARRKQRMRWRVGKIREGQHERRLSG